MADLVSCLLVAIMLIALVFGIVQQRGYTPPARPSAPDTRQSCDGDDWRDLDPHRCTSVFCDDTTIHRCAASDDHPVYDPGSDHVDLLGHRWPQTKPRRRHRPLTRRGSR